MTKTESELELVKIGERKQERDMRKFSWEREEKPATQFEKRNLIQMLLVKRSWQTMKRDVIFADFFLSIQTFLFRAKKPWLLQLISAKIAKFEL